MNNKRLTKLYHEGIISEIDFHFARFITGLCPGDDPDIFMGAALVSNAAGNGDIYLDLTPAAGKPVVENHDADPGLICPELGVWTEKLRASPVVGSPGEFRPLILDHKNRLYLYRYWEYEKKLSDSIIKRAQEGIKTVDETRLKKSLQRLFPIGPFGVNAVNRLAEQVLSRQGLINPEQDWYLGRPVLITRNDYSLGLFNGDMGITLPDPDSDTEDLYVYFPGDSGQLRRFPPHRLPEHETVFAMTVHKSQGSEFDDVLLVLPEKDYPVLTRELVYTAITRARQTISVWGTEDVIKAAIARKIERTSGLREALWESV